MDDGTGDTAIRDASPEPDRLELAVARARVASKLFGDAEPIKVGRYSLIERVGAGGMGVVWQAYDSELGRAVALKLASSGSEDVRARARDEGRALAKLSHPNVVPIYDVIEVEDGVFLVMELVKGKTLRALAAEGETAGALVRAYRQAGEGLAAAHAVGLVHRDFKPENAIMGADGRVRVLDFGLAFSGEDAPDVAGTPRYMAPEQADGKSLTAAVDQYALCVALREAVTMKGTVPRWLEPVLARGAAAAPADRYPSMDALLRALALDPRARWKRRALVGSALLAVGAVVLAFSIGRANRETSPCEGGPQLIADSWGAVPRAKIARHFADSLKTQYALDTTPRLLTVLDNYARGWTRVHRTSCELHRRGEISADLLDRRAGCLARRRGALRAISELAGTVTPDELPKLAVAVGELPDLTACEDDDALIANVAPPAKLQAAEASAIAELAARADVERDAGHYDNAVRDADAALTRARALKYRPLVANALLARGRVTLAVSSDDRGAKLFEEATHEALAAGDHPLAVEAFARRAWAVATHYGPDGATEGLALIEALLENLGDRAKFARALLHMNLGSVALAKGDRAAAREVLERARTEAVAIGGSGAIELTAVYTNLLLVVEDPARRDQVANELVELRTRYLGALHPSTLTSRTLVANMLDNPDELRSKLGAACSELAKHYPTLGSKIAQCGYELVWHAFMAGDRDAARVAAKLVIDASPSVPEGEKDLVAFAKIILQLDENRDAALAALVGYQADAAKLPPAWWNDFYIADAAAVEAVARRQAGDREGATRAFATADLHYAKTTNTLPEPIKKRRAAAVEAARR